MLNGIKVLDLTRLLPGPYATMVLGDLGADVLKIEQPGTADYSRWSPPFRGGTSAYFAMVNRNKRSMTLDLKTAEGRSIMERLIAEADVLVESFRPGVTTRLGIDFERAKSINPMLVYCSVSGYGQSGSLSALAGHDLNIQGLAGMLTIGETNGEARMPGLAVADMAGALWAVIGILSSINSREGAVHLDVPLLDSAFSFMLREVYLASTSGRHRPQLSALYGQSPRYNVYRTRDGRHLTLSALETKFWQRLCEVIGRPDLADPNEGPEARLEPMVNAEEVFAVLRAEFAARDAHVWLKLLKDADIPCYPALSLEEVLTSDHVRESGLLWTLEHEGEDLLQMSLPVRGANIPRQSAKLPPPRLGQHTDEVLRALGYDDEWIARLRAEEVV